MDIVYVLGDGSRWGDNEIRYSLRSVQKNLGGAGKIVIVGQLPEFIQNIIHIEAKDIFNPGGNADGNIITKVLAACRDKRVSENFLLMADDCMILKPVRAKKIPFFHKGNMAEFNEPGYFKHNIWRQRLGCTRDVLLQRGLTSYHFDCHRPMIINKKSFCRIMAKYDYASGIGFCIKSLYANTAGVTPVRVKNMRYTIFKNYTVDEINDRLGEHTFLSVNDSGLTETMKKWIVKKFHEKSKYEK